jgi:hypothetical protein
LTRKYLEQPSRSVGHVGLWHEVMRSIAPGTAEM